MLNKTIFFAYKIYKNEKKYFVLKKLKFKSLSWKRTWSTRFLNHCLLSWTFLDWKRCESIFPTVLLQSKSLRFRINFPSSFFFGLFATKIIFWLFHLFCHVQLWTNIVLSGEEEMESKRQLQRRQRSGAKGKSKWSVKEDEEDGWCYDSI